jgi:hypothetical protein
MLCGPCSYAWNYCRGNKRLDTFGDWTSELLVWFRSLLAIQGALVAWVGTMLYLTLPCLLYHHYYHIIIPTSLAKCCGSLLMP